MKIDNYFFTADGDIEQDVKNYLRAQKFLATTFQEIFDLDTDTMIAIYHINYDLLKVYIPDMELTIYLRYALPSSCAEEYRYEIIWDGSLLDAKKFLAKTKVPIEKK